MTEKITMTVDSEDKKLFEEFSGMKLFMDNLKYGGKLGLDPFWSEENQNICKNQFANLKKAKG